MLKTSPDQPYYLKYSDLGWLDRPLPPAPEFFPQKTIDRLCRIGGADDESDRPRLADELRTIADIYWVAAMSSPLGVRGGAEALTPNARKRKIKGSILHPAEKLIEALSDESLPVLSEWPDELPSPPPNRHALVEELTKLSNRTRDLLEVLDDRKRKGSAVSQEFKIDFANALAGVFERYFPHAQPSRGGYDRTPNPSSEYQAFLTACAQEVFGDDFKFSGNILDEVAKLRGNR
ncbi:hypothetical protein [Cognatiyoonia sp. IB215182]|uniref:hypothetical protein n=1 Tax=Cognatiyoonia sp. IB215182 TaxID=3097353 RepID=UPI002A1459E7|nr:hypothetical protein [Cognatiyoonia sp. IB215182]MDX8353958.1 hypothetical protein [Cognatiyoonia sp. IB215182]